MLLDRVLLGGVRFTIFSCVFSPFFSDSALTRRRTLASRLPELLDRGLRMLSLLLFLRLLLSVGSRLGDLESLLLRFSSFLGVNGGSSADFSTCKISSSDTGVPSRTFLRCEEPRCEISSGSDPSRGSSFDGVRLLRYCRFPLFDDERSLPPLLLLLLLLAFLRSRRCEESSTLSS